MTIDAHWFRLKGCPRCERGDLIRQEEVRPYNLEVVCIQCGWREDWQQYRRRK